MAQYDVPKTLRWKIYCIIMCNGHQQDFVHEATQIDKLTNSEQNRHLQTINSKKNRITKSHNHYNFNIKDGRTDIIEVTMYTTLRMVD